MLERQEVEAMINAKVAPIARQVKRQGRRISTVEKRIEQVESDVQVTLGLVQRVISEGMGRIEIKLDSQHADIVRRLDTAEGWIGRRRRIEKVALRASQVAVVAFLRRWVPLVALVVGIFVTSYGLTIILGG